MHGSVFQHPRSWRFRFLISTPVWVVGSAVAVVFPVVARSPFAIVLVPIGLWSLLHIASKLLLLASTISVSDIGIAAKTYLGGSKEIRWKDVTIVEKFDNRTFDYRTMIRIKGSGVGGSITFTDAISDFPVLVELITEGAPAAREVRMPLIWRIMLV